MKERHGVADAVKLSMINDGHAAVHVTDGAHCIHLTLENATWGAGLTAEQARWIAVQLERAALRLECKTKAAKP